MVIVGLDPGNNGREPLDPDYPSGKRLADLMGLSGEDFRRIDRVNLHSSPRPVGEDPRAASNLRPILRGRRVLALGERVARAIGVREDLMRWELSGEFVAARVPHPSGRCRRWNDPENAARAREFLSGSRRPCVHLEGTDGSGKTTLARELSAIGGLALVGTEDPPTSWEECLARVERRVSPGLVCDRSSGLVSELVYGPVLRGGCLVEEEKLWEVVRAVRESVVFVYCRPPDEAVSPTFREGEDPGHVRGVRERRGQLQARYDEVMARVSREGCRVVRYDRTRQTPREVMACAE